MFEKRDLLKAIRSTEVATHWEPDEENGDGWDQYHLFTEGGTQIGGVMREISGNYRVWGKLDACSSIESKGFKSADLAKAATIPIIKNALQLRLKAIEFAENYPKDQEAK